MNLHQVVPPQEHYSSSTDTLATPELDVHRNALAEFESGCRVLVQKFKNSLDLDASNGQVTQAHETLPPNSIQATCPQDILALLDSRLMEHHTAAAPLTTAQIQPSNELSSQDDPFAGDPFPDLVQEVSNATSTKPAGGNNMAQKQQGKKLKKNKKKNVSGTEPDDLPTFPTVSQVQDPQIEYITTNGSMADPRRGQLYLPCAVCLDYWWVVQFDSPTIPSKVISGDHERAMGFTVCLPRCGNAPIDASKMEERGQFRRAMMPLHQSMAELARESLHINATIVTDANGVLFVPQDVICGIAKSGGTIKCFKRDVGYDWA